MHIVIVSGPEATGKSTIAKKISADLGYTYLSKDVIKENLYDTCKRSTWDHQWYEQKAKRQFFKQIKNSIETKKDIIIESNFDTVDKDALTNIMPQSSTVSEIYCFSRGFTSFRRFVRRNESGNRHKGHHDRRWYFRVFCQDCARLFGSDWPHYPVAINNKLMRLDTTKITEINFEMIKLFLVKETG